MRFSRRTRFFSPPPASTAVDSRRVLAIAVPIMASNVSEPLIGIVDTAVIGQLPGAHYIGAVAVGALIFSFVYWGFGFLRMGTGGFAAQSYGAGDLTELRAILGRALLIAIGAGVVLIVFAPVIGRLAFSLIDGSSAVEEEAADYFYIRIWSAPFALANYAILGWFIGMGATRIAFVVQIFLNVTNMILDAVFVMGFSMAAAGVGLGTLIAEVLAAALGLFLVAGRLKAHGGRWDVARIFERRRLVRTFVVNGDIMVRTFCLAFAFWWFTAEGARAGDIVIAANAVLMQMVTLSAFLIDGFAHSAEVLTGQAVGAGERRRYRSGARLSTLWAGLVSCVLGLMIFAVGEAVIDMLTVNETIRALARTYLPWAAIAPVAGFACFQLDGIFIGATQTTDMRNMMICSLVVFLVAAHVLTGWFGNHGLWASLIVFYIARAVSLTCRLPRLERTAFAARG